MTDTQKKDAPKDEPRKADSDAAQSPQETGTPRDPSQAIPDIALPRYLDPRKAGDTSNPQL